jgi:hypothetical protein
MGAFARNFAAIDFSKEIPAPPKRRHEFKRSDLPAPMVITDIIEPVQSQETGKFYDSKSALRAEYRAYGNIEIGNDKREKRKPARTSRKDIKKVVEKAAARVERGERNLFPGK